MNGYTETSNFRFGDQDLFVVRVPQESDCGSQGRRVGKWLSVIFCLL